MIIVIDKKPIEEIACFECNTPGGDGPNCSQILND